MKCSKCGGYIIIEPAYSFYSEERKCINCGNRPDEVKIYPEIIKNKKRKEKIMEQEVKTCSKCENQFPKTSEFFYAKRQAKDGFDSWCRECTKKRVKNRKIERILERKGELEKKLEKKTLPKAEDVTPDILFKTIRRSIIEEIIQIFREDFEKTIETIRESYKY